MKNHSAALILIPFLTLTSCTPFRAIRCGNPSPDTYLNFSLDTVSAGRTGKNIFVYSDRHDRYFEDSKFSGGRLSDETIGEYFARVRGNGALFIVRNDTVLLEKYYGNFSERHTANIFSITKAMTSLLCGIAVDEGFISLTDPVTKFIPELNKADPLFKQLTVEHLLDMRTGLDFKSKRNTALILFPKWLSYIMGRMWSDSSGNCISKKNPAVHIIIIQWLRPFLAS